MLGFFQLAFGGWPKDEKQHRKMAGLLPADNPGPDYDVPFEARRCCLDLVVAMHLFWFPRDFPIQKRMGDSVGDKKTTFFSWEWIFSAFNFWDVSVFRLTQLRFTSALGHVYPNLVALLNWFLCTKSLQLPLLDPGKTWMEYRISWAPRTSQGGHNLKWFFVNLLGPFSRLDGDFVVSCSKIFWTNLAHQALGKIRSNFFNHPSSHLPNRHLRSCFPCIP